MRTKFDITPEQYHACLDLLWGALSQVNNTEGGNVFQICHDLIIKQNKEIEVLRTYMNKDCESMADERLEELNNKEIGMSLKDRLITFNVVKKFGNLTVNCRYEGFSTDKLEISCNMSTQGVYTIDELTNLYENVNSAKQLYSLVKSWIDEFDYSLIDNRWLDRIEKEFNKGG